MFLFGFLALGEFVVWLTGVKLPASIIGMLLLTFSLKVGVMKLEWIKELTDFLMRNLGFFFIPPGVALMLHLDLITEEFVPIVGSMVISTVLVLLVTAWVYQAVRKYFSK